MISKNKIFLLLFCLFFLFANFSFVSANNGVHEDYSGKVKFVPQIGIPDSKFEAGKEVVVDGGTFIDYLKAIYMWAVGAIAIIAIVMIMIAGFQWMTAAGNASAIGQAKSRISSSLIGLLLAIGAYSLLNFVNPSLVHLRTLDLGNIEYVDLNIAKTICNDGALCYEWHDHRCFEIMKNDNHAEQYFPLSEFGIISLEPDIIYYDMILDLGVDDNYISGCDVKNDFWAIEHRIFKHLFTPGHPRFILLDGRYDQDIDPEKNFYDYIKNGCAGIMVIADYDANESLTGLNVTVANKSAGKASAYIKNIEISTNKSCHVCCETKKGFFSGKISFLQKSACTEKGEIIDPSICCQRINPMTKCENLDIGSCVTYSQWCNKCHWDVENKKCID